MLTSPGLRLITKMLYPKSTISHFKVNNAVAFTIDDGFCGIDNADGCMLDDTRKLLNKYNAHATFFITGSHCKNTTLTSVNQLIDDGHEIANHSMMDWTYKNYSKADFKSDLLLTKKVLSQYNQKYSYWYRAPMGQLSNNMNEVLHENNMVHVLPDTFAHDTYIPDPKWISKYILKRIKPGSIILIHMPEKNIRQWNYEAIELTLKGIQEKNMSILNLTEMKQLEKRVISL